VKNYDADTITVNIPGLHPVVGKNMNIRVRGVDTPEIRTKNSCEKEKGRHAKKLVRNLLKKAKRIDLTNIERGKYFRIVADVVIDGKSLTAYLVKNGLGYPYEGGTKKTINWCKDLKTLAKEFQSIQSSRSRARKAASE
jgi:endonuclease YncB( thermonuclease family)